MSDESQALIGKLLKNRYEVLRELGRGGMAIVYLCMDRDLGRKVVVKAPKKALAAESEFRQRFEREIRSQLGLEHPHICKVMDAETRGPFPYVVLQYLSGGDLNDRLKATALPMPMKDVLAWLPQVAKALDFIHSKGWVHRDVKPGNTMFDEHGNAFVGDFGIARAASSTDMELTQTGALIGSPQYMAPDLMLGHELSPAYDQYALACMVYAALSKRIPHQASTPIAIVHLRAIRPIPPLSDYVKGVPPAIEAAVMRALERDPKERFDSCEDFYEAVRDGDRNQPMPTGGGGLDEATMLIGEEERTQMVAAREAEEATRVGALSAETATPSSGTLRGSETSATVASPVPGARSASPMQPTMLSVPRRGPGRLLAALGLLVLVLGGAAFAGWKWLSGQSPPRLVDLRLEPGAAIADLSSGIQALVGASPATIEGRVDGATLKSIRALARPNPEPFYADLPMPTTSCEVVDEGRFRCTFEGRPGRYDLDLTLSSGLQELTRRIDLRVADEGLVPLPPLAAGRPRFQRLQDSAMLVEVPAGAGLKRFLIDEHEVSWAQFFRYLQSVGRREAMVPDWATLESPVVNVDFETAGSYCAWASARLPTSAEWRRAAAGDDARSFPWGASWSSGKANTADPDGHRFAAPVHEFPSGASPFGVLNLVGNVAEWAADEPSRGKARLVGGSFRDRGEGLSNDYSETAPVGALSIAYGLRCAMDLPPAS